MTERTWLLAIDTSTEWSGVAVTDGHDWAELNWTSGRNQTTQVLPEIERLLNRTGITIGNIGAIAVATGPGSFSGLRVGLSLAKGFALAESIPIIGISTLEATTRGWDIQDRPVVGVVRAGRRRLVWGMGSETGEPGSGEIADLLAVLPSNAVVVGELSDESAAALTRAGHLVPHDPVRRRRAGSVAALGLRRWTAGSVDDPVSLEPVYLHPS